MLMSDTLVRRALEESELEITNFDGGCLEPASYDMRLGEEAITSSRREKVNPADRGLLVIPAGDFALVTTHERVKLSNNIAGHIGLRFYYTKKGLVPLSGPQIDPGYSGALVLGLSNLSPRDVTIAYKDKFCTVEFYRLSEPAARPYSGEYQGQTGISPRDLEALVEAQGLTFGEVIKTLGQISQNVKSLSDSVTFLKWAFPIALAISTGILAIGIAVLGVIVSMR